jgi:hypothetical protein
MKVLGYYLKIGHGRFLLTLPIYYTKKQKEIFFVTSAITTMVNMNITGAGRYVVWEKVANFSA